MSETTVQPGPSPAPQVPRHVAIIMDGNGRWARARGLPRHEGHRAGTENIRPILRACRDMGVKVLSVYAFSTENWSRPIDEVRGLMRLLALVIRRDVDELDREGVQIRHCGRLDGLSLTLRRLIKAATDRTRKNSSIILNVALNYGGRAEILDAVRRILADRPDPATLDEATFSGYLYTAGLPDPDLVIRTAGEMRLSNFLLWQAAYAEYYSTPVYWPDFNVAELQKAFEAYAARQRRFGGVPGAGDEFEATLRKK
jgi:undecaprenyl diphosphate synthase